MTSKSHTPRHARYAGLDGMRAIAVALVVTYHLFPQSWVRGGFIGVDVFFVISGFLITTLLLREHAGSGRIDLLGFWRRRARRLIPALVAVVTVCATGAWLIGGDVLMRLGEQVLGAATFSYNWVSIADGTGYFAAAAPELFRNFWSLAVEEQFYVLWPLLLPLFLLLPRAAGRAAAALALAAASAVWMGVVATGGDITRAYFGTDTHAFGILLGIALAFLLQSRLARARSGDSAPAGSRRVRIVTAVVGATAIAGLLAVASLPPTFSAATFPGAVGAASILSAVAVVAGVWPGSAFGRVIDLQPLRWIGERSYGIYLWHWPLLVLLVAGVQNTSPDAGVPLWIGGLALALTLVAAELSYRLLETPVRRHGFRGSLSRVGRRLFGSPAARVRAIAGVGAVAVLLGGTSAAIAAAPAVSSGQSAVQAGMDALDAAGQGGADAAAGQGGTGSGSGSGSGSGTGSVSGSGSGSGTGSDAGSAGIGAGGQGTAVDAGADAGTTPRTSGSPQRPTPRNPVPAPSPTPVTGDQITAVGDSVMLASAPGLLDLFPGIVVDAAVSRSSWAGPGILQSLDAAGQLRPVVVVALGTNGPLSGDAMEEMAQIVGPHRRLILVNAFAPRDWIPGVNADLAAFAAAHPGVVVADWSGAISSRTELLAGDHIHPGDAGGRVFAETVAAAVDRAEQYRAHAQYRIDLRAYLRLHHSLGRIPQ